MQSIKHYFMFIQMNIRQIKRKWLTLPLLLLSPIIIVGAIVMLMIHLMTADEQTTIDIGVVDQDQSMETETMIQFLSETSQLGPYIQLHTLSEQDADKGIEANELSAYIVFPDNFTDNLYVGESVTLPVIGNTQQQVQSNIVKELIDSVMRHINTSQANILLINRYAKDFIDDKDVRNDYLFDQFISFFMYALSKGNVLTNEEMVNQATASTKDYFGVSALFILHTFWLFIVYQLLYREETKRLANRMKLYGVKEIQQVLARMTVTFGFGMLLIIAAFLGFNYFFSFTLDIEDYKRLFMMISLYSIVYLQLLALIEMILSSPKLRLLIQFVFSLLIIVISGAIIPTLYFPSYIQDKLEFIFSYDALYWIQEILLNERLYADYMMGFIYSLSGMILLMILSNGKERLKR